MYKELHHYYYDHTLAHADIYSNHEGRHPSEYYRQCPTTVFIDLNTIARITSLSAPYKDGTVDLRLSSVLFKGNDPQDTLIISAEEAEQIKKALTSHSKDMLEKELSELTRSIRDLWNLLRARMH